MIVARESSAPDGAVLLWKLCMGRLGAFGDRGVTGMRWHDTIIVLATVWLAVRFEEIKGCSKLRGASMMQA